jgi:hypothetical protein
MVVNLAYAVNPNNLVYDFDEQYLLMQKKVRQLHDLSIKYGWELAMPCLPNIDMFRRYLSKDQNNGMVLSATLNLWARTPSYDFQFTFGELLLALKDQLSERGFILKFPDTFKINPQHLKLVYSGSEQRRDAGISPIAIKHGVYQDSDSDCGCRIVDLWKESRLPQSLPLMATEVLTEAILDTSILTNSDHPVLIPGCNYRKGSVLQFVRLNENTILLDTLLAQKYIRGHISSRFESLS